MSFIKSTRRLAALLLALTLVFSSAFSAFAAASGTDVSSADAVSDSDAAKVSDSDVSASDVPEEEPVDLNLGTVKAKAALLVDIDTGEILYEQNADEALPPASTTKIMTALLVFEAAERGQLTLDEQLTAGKEELDVIPWDASTVNPKIASGETMTILDYLYCVMLTSDCASCNVLAKRVAGSVDTFISMMNQRAAELGCTGVNFKNTHGYPTAGHVASARDLYLITQKATSYPTFCEIVAERDYVVPATNINAERKIINTNGLVVGSSGYSYVFATGVKTGYSKSSGHCLVSTAYNNDRHLLAVILGADKPTIDGKAVYEHFTESKRLLEWGFNAFSWQAITTAGFTAQEIPLSGGELPSITLVYDETAFALLPVDFDMSQLEYKTDLYFSSATAPVVKGADFGTVDVLRDGKLLATVSISAGADYMIKKTVDSTLVYVIAGGAALAFLCLILAIKQARSRKSGYGYDAVTVDPASDPKTFNYGDRPIYRRGGRAPQISRPTYTDSGYYTRRPQQEQYDYRRMDNFSDGRSGYNGYGNYSGYSDYYEEDPQEPRQPAPIFPRNWKPPENRG